MSVFGRATRHRYTHKETKHSSLKIHNTNESFSVFDYMFSGANLINE